jgi:hypothetical protein
MAETKTKKPRRKSLKLPGLSCAVIDGKPTDYDWSEGYPEVWEVAFDTSKEPCESCNNGKVKCSHQGCEEGKVHCSKCDGKGTIDNPDYDPDAKDNDEEPQIECDECYGDLTEDCPECSGDGEVDCEDCDGSGMRDCDNDGWFPMMNYYYPLPDGFDVPDNVQSLLVCTTIVRFEADDKLVLVLTGGGMNLSWEICESYINLGLYPPAHFARLARMCGRGESENDQRIMAYCRESLRIHADQARYELEGFDRDFPNAPLMKEV